MLNDFSLARGDIRFPPVANLIGRHITRLWPYHANMDQVNTPEGVAYTFSPGDEDPVHLYHRIWELEEMLKLQEAKNLKMKLKLSAASDYVHAVNGSIRKAIDWRAACLKMVDHYRRDRIRHNLTSAGDFVCISRRARQDGKWEQAYETVLQAASDMVVNDGQFAEAVLAELESHDCIFDEIQDMANSQFAPPTSRD